MKRVLRPSLQAIVALVSCYTLATVRAQTAPLKLTETIALSGVEGRIDHFAFDAAGERLFVCALGNNTVEVVDLRKGVRVHSITGFGAPQGIAYIPELNRIFVANDKGGICKIYDGKSFQGVGELDFKDDADNVRYDSTTKQIYVGFGSGGIAVVNPPDGKQIGSIKLSAHPEAFELEKNGKRIFVNLPNARQVAVIDRGKGEVIATWKTDLAFGNFPMALDETNHRLFLGCRMPSKLIVLNTDSGDVVTKRIQDVKQLYDTTDTKEALSILHRYNVRYLIVGQLERAYYRADGIAKFERMLGDSLELAYENAQVRIYKIVG